MLYVVDVEDRADAAHAAAALSLYASRVRDRRSRDEMLESIAPRMIAAGASFARSEFARFGVKKLHDLDRDALRLLECTLDAC